MLLIWHKYDNIFYNNGPKRSCWCLCKYYRIDTTDYFKTGKVKRVYFYDVFWFDKTKNRFVKPKDEVVMLWAYIERKESKWKKLGKKLVKKIKWEGGAA